MDEKIKFIVLPQDELLTEAEASMLMGGDNCTSYKIIISGSNVSTSCGKFDNEQCTEVGGCGDNLFCTGHETIYG